MNEQALQALMNIIKSRGCEVEYVVSEKPEPVKVSIPVTQEQMDFIVEHAKPIM